MQSLREGGWMAWALLVLVLLVLATPILTYPLGRDQGEFAIIGSGILNGAAPYVDLWNPKPPAVFYTYAGTIALLGHHAAALRALDLLLFPMMALALYSIGRRLEGNALGLWAVLFYGVFYFTETFWTLTQNDGIAAVPMALAAWGVFNVLDAERAQQRVMWSALCGALSALTLWFKYPYLFFVLALVLGYLSVRRRVVWAEVAAFVGGGLLVGLGGMAYLATQGAFGAWIESAQVTAGYTAQGYDWGTFRADMWKYIGFRWGQWHLLWVLGGLGLGLLSVKFAPNRTENHNRIVTDRLRWRIIVAWLMGTAVAMFVQAKGYDYHWLPMLPPLALLAGSTVTTLQRSVPYKTANQYILIVSVLGLMALLAMRTWGTALPYLMGREPQADYYARFVGGEFVADESYAVAQYLKQHANPGDSLYIWGFRPEVYFMSNMRPASRFIFQFPLAAEWYPTEWQQQNVDTLWASLPPYVLVLRGDFMPWVTGKNADSNMLLQEYTELNNWLIYNYERETEIGSFLIWRRKP